MRTLVCFILLLVLALTIESAGAAFPGRNGKLAYVSDRAGSLDVWAVRADGSGEVRLTTDPAVDRQPSWSPDGRRIAFASSRDGDFEVYVMAADGSRQTRLTHDPADDFEPAWSPSGTFLAFSSTRSGNQDIWVMNADGSALHNLTGQNPAVDQQPAWSPDGSRIAFSSLRPDLVSGGCSSELYSMSADGTDPVRLTSDAACQFSPAWSPDGQRIAYVAEFEPNATTDELWVMNADGSGQARIIGGVDPASDVSWSPDGTRIAITAYRDGARDVAVVAPDGTALTLVTAGTHPDLQPDWQRAPSDPWQRAAEELEMPVLRPLATPGFRLVRVVSRELECGRVTQELDAHYTGSRGKQLHIAEGKPSYCGDIGDAPLLERLRIHAKRASLYEYCKGSGCTAASNTYLLTWRELGVQIVLISRGASKKALIRIAQGMRRIEGSTI